MCSTFDLSFGSNSVDYQQLGCLWHQDYLVSVGLNGNIYYLDRAHPNEPRLIIKVLAHHPSHHTRPTTRHARVCVR